MTLVPSLLLAIALWWALPRLYRGIKTTELHKDKTQAFRRWREAMREER